MFLFVRRRQLAQLQPKSTLRPRAIPPRRSWVRPHPSGSSDTRQFGAVPKPFVKPRYFGSWRGMRASTGGAHCAASLRSCPPQCGVPDSAGRALGLRRWEYRRLQSHAQRNSPEAIAQRKQLRSARVLDSAANKRGRPAYNAHHDPALGAPKQRRKFDLKAAKEKMASHSASSSSSANPSPRPRDGYSGARDVRCELCVDTAGAGGASSAAYAAAAAVGEGDDADDEAPAAAASGKRSRAPLLVGCFFCCRECAASNMQRVGMPRFTRLTCALLAEKSIGAVRGGVTSATRRCNCPCSTGRQRKCRSSTQRRLRPPPSARQEKRSVMGRKKRVSIARTRSNLINKLPRYLTHLLPRAP